MFQWNYVCGIFWGISLFGCAPPPSTVDNELLPYVDTFEQTYNIKVKIPVRLSATLSIKTKKDDSVILGECTYYEDEPDLNYIDIDSTHWKHLTHNVRESLIFHELGHCVLGMSHNEKEIDGIPVSFMHPHVIGESPHYQEFRSLYIDELWENRKYLR
jgi:hypothetical protein